MFISSLRLVTLLLSVNVTPALPPVLPIGGEAIYPVEERVVEQVNQEEELPPMMMNLTKPEKKSPDIDKVVPPASEPLESRSSLMLEALSTILESSEELQQSN